MNIEQRFKNDDQRNQYNDDQNDYYSDYALARERKGSSVQQDYRFEDQEFDPESNYNEHFMYNRPSSSRSQSSQRRSGFAVGEGYGSSGEDQRYRTEQAWSEQARDRRARQSNEDDRWSNNQQMNDWQQASSQEGYRGMGPKGYARSDERIEEEVCEALTQDNEVDASNIEVEVEEGIVTLSGTVSDRRTKKLAENCVEDISGVKDVRNNLTIGQEQENKMSLRKDSASKSDAASMSSGKSSGKASKKKAGSNKATTPTSNLI